MSALVTAFAVIGGLFTCIAVWLGVLTVVAGIVDALRVARAYHGHAFYENRHEANRKVIEALDGEIARLREENAMLKAQSPYRGPTQTGSADPR